MYLLLLLIIIITLIIFSYGKESWNCYKLKTDMSWNNINILNNCYSYAFNDVYKGNYLKPEPGFKSKSPLLKNNDYTCSEIVKRVLNDYPDAKFLGNDPNLITHDCGCNRHLVYLVLDDEGNKDFHFYRRDYVIINGKSKYIWSHKPGNTVVSVLDGKNNIVTNPITADKKNPFYDYKTQCGFFCVNSFRN